MHDTLRGVVVTVAYEMCHGSNGVRCHERSEGGFIHSHISRAMREVCISICYEEEETST